MLGWKYKGRVKQHGVGKLVPTSVKKDHFRTTPKKTSLGQFIFIRLYSNLTEKNKILPFFAFFSMNQISG